MKKHLLFLFSVLFSASLIAQDCSDLFISEYVEGTGNNKAIELYNPTNEPIDLVDYYLVRYRNGGFEPNQVELTGVVQPKSTVVCVLDKRDPGGTGYEEPIDSALMEKADLFLCPVYEVNKMMYFNGNDAVTLEKKTGEIVDIFAQIGPPMLDDDNGWTDITDTTITWNNGGVLEDYTIQHYICGPLFWLSWTENHTLIRKPHITHGVVENPVDFMVHVNYDSIPVNTFDSLGFHWCDCTTFGIDEATHVDFNLYPNPTNQSNFTVSSEFTVSSLEIINMLGVIENWMGSYNVQLENEIKGVYFVRLGFENGKSVTRKIVIR